jgi:hypothetical protein
MERKDEQNQPEEQQKPMAQEKEKRKPDEQNEENENTVGKVSDPQGEDAQRDRSQK